jgi:hypothetical protein
MLLTSLDEGDVELWTSWKRQNLYRSKNKGRKAMGVKQGFVTLQQLSVGLNMQAAGCVFVLWSWCCSMVVW